MLDLKYYLPNNNVLLGALLMVTTLCLLPPVEGTGPWDKVARNAASRALGPALPLSPPCSDSLLTWNEEEIK